MYPMVLSEKYWHMAATPMTATPVAAPCVMMAPEATTTGLSAAESGVQKGAVPDLCREHQTVREGGGVSVVCQWR